ncbi:alpha/beta fold hydrolase [Priestia megaterium]|uniref:alpha/beta fold hydrolase n=1 Tax=Priestia megaterium TaxID=1404 RepID=UPI00159C524E|nr:alpha/beta hydrolase [Priestia megaterium]
MNNLELDYQGNTYSQSYDKSLELWPIKFSTRFIKTSQGITHVIDNGNELNPPIILLHGARMSSTMWYLNIADWSKDYRVVCIDILGDKNKSILEKEFTDRFSYALWLKEVLDELHISKTHIVGLSYGALHTVNFLSFFPEMVNKSVIMSPAATYLPFSPTFYSYAFELVHKKEGVERFLNWIFNNRYKVHPFIKAQLIAGIEKVSSVKKNQKEEGFPYIFRDEELIKIDNPFLLLLGEKEVMYDSSKAFYRARNSSPNLTVEMVEGVGHLMSMEKPKYINRKVLDFFSK